MGRHIHRADFHRGLLECATDLGVEVHLNSRVLEVNPHAPSLSTKGGQIHNADLIGAADGIFTLAQSPDSD